MTEHDDARAKAVEAAVEAFEKTTNGLAYALRHAPAENRGWATEAAIAAYERAMAEAGWVMVRDVGEKEIPTVPTLLEPTPRVAYAQGWNACRAAMLAGQVGEEG